MKRYLLLLIAVCFFIPAISYAQQNGWQLKTDKIVSTWAENIDVTNVHQEYPRPQMVREDWVNLNGLWDYAITPKEANKPANFEGNILVPFAVESALSGVGRTVGKDSILWYNTNFKAPSSRNKRLLLHFGAVDWKSEIFINGQSVATHEGGFDPFTVDITDYVKGRTQELTVKVWDPTDEGPQPRGKQIRNPHGIWYTPVTGIWQTVWIEAVPETHIVSTKHTPDIDNEELSFTAKVANAKAGDQLRVTVLDGQQEVSSQEFGVNEEIKLAITNQKLWSPENPHLYDLNIELLRNGKVIDQVDSYFAMRKISMEKDSKGIQRMLLNNEFVFQYGPLDQGWWPDGLYTAPSDEALKFDVIKTKEMGFNMIRKHIKVEPARWYYHCDQLGMLVWQDMPSGDLGNRWDSRPGVFGLATEQDRSAESEAYYKKEWNLIMDALHNFPSIVMWVPFNEAWGQFKTKEITEWTMEKDPSRIVNSASGGNFHPTGHIVDLHNYPEPAMPSPDLFGEDYILILGEFGGLGLPVDDHVWQQKDNWGYQSFKTPDELFDRYSALMDRIPNLIRAGLSGAVYTQTTDVEVEVNGLMTYDRKVIKIPVEKLKQVHQKLYDPSLVD
ncbi:glycoside hydrolase family 2 protein [Albibacterium indicum]|uniref:glycoside hydrolase family 2 protein n=1 Tax=Albibacterium indicum TaxID=2292082 RepID=UPI000E5325F5|nr:sugar-binding domain-containing protein [Pedobacter indicus]